MAITSFQGLRDFINTFLINHDIDVGGAPHSDFWNSMPYDEFVNGLVPGILNPTGGDLPVKILVIGNANESNLIKILRGKLTIDGITMPQMPFGGDKMSDAETAEIAGWIDCGCPQ